MRNKCCYILLLLFVVQCRNAYNVTPATNGNGVLVVEGVLNANGKTTINLSRTTRLSDKRIAPEKNALLFIESETDGSAFPMHESDAGIYESDSLVFDPLKKYRLKIVTIDNRQYATAYKQFIITPVVDSLSWQRTNDGVTILTHAHDDVNNTRFYKLDYEETWEFHSAYRATIHFVEAPPNPNGYKLKLEYLVPATQSVDLRLFICYNDRMSSNINIASTEALGTSVLLLPLKTYAPASIELSVLYSMLVKQYALSAEGYNFFSRMKKNTESLGSIFDAQPSELSGNITCLTDPSELVIGYVEFTTVESKRVFINNEDLGEWGYDLDCPVSADVYDNDPGLFEDIVKRGFVPTTPARTGPGGGVITFNVNTERCVDCRLRGSNVKPDFWP